MYYTYLLRCADGSLYAGITTDLLRRLEEHAGRGGRGARYTASRAPVGFAAAWSAPGRAEAARLEYRLKTLNHAQKERLLCGEPPPELDLTEYARIDPLPIRRTPTMLFVCYPSCTTCRKARAFLEAREAAFTVRHIKNERPTKEELRAWWRQSGLPLTRFFNTSGRPYRELGLSKRLSELDEEQQLELLSSDGMLVKRPILVAPDFVLVGFKPEEWEARLSAGSARPEGARA